MHFVGTVVQRNDLRRTDAPEPQTPEQSGATAVITHRVKKGEQSVYEAWLDEIGPLCRQAPGHLDVQIIRPIPGLTGTYTVVMRFDSHENLANWLQSDQRRALIDKVRPILCNEDDFFIRSGLDFWFAPEGAPAQVPVRWKQLLITWSAIYPLVLSLPLIVPPIIHRLGIPSVRYLDALFVSGVAVSVMIYLIMPRYTKLVQRWLFR